MSKLKLRSKIFILLLGIVILFGTAMILIVINGLHQQLHEEVEAKGIFITSHLADMLADQLLSGNGAMIQMMLHDYKNDEKDLLYIFIRESPGSVRVHTFNEGFPSALKGINSVAAGKEYSIQSLKIGKLQFLDVAVPIMGGRLGEVHLGISEAQIRISVNRLRDAIVLAIILALCLSVLLAVFFAGRLTKPLSELVNAAHAIGNGHLDHQVQVRANDEIGQLGATINRMSSNLLNSTVSREKYQKQSEFLRNIIESIPHPFYVIDVKDYSIKLANSAASALGEWEDSTCYALTHNRSSPCAHKDHRCPLIEVVQTKKPLVTEHVHFDKQGNRRIHEVHGYPLPDEKGDVVQMIEYSYDITDRKKAGEDLKLYAERLKQSNKELEDFLTIAAHDLQEPLRKVITMGDRVKSQYADILGKEGNDYLSRMSNATGRTQALINDLRIFSRLFTRAKPFIAVKLSQIMEEVKASLAEKIAQTEGQVDTGNLAVIEADPTQIYQLFRNLMDNALKFHQQNLPPLIKISGMVVKKGRQGPDRNHGGREFYQVTVKDNGIGFDEKYRERIFGVFQRLHSHDAYQGTGMGLSICRKIVQRHNGSIGVESSPGQGARFIVTLPLNQSEEERSRDEKQWKAVDNSDG